MDIQLPSHIEAEEVFIGILINNIEVATTLLSRPSPDDFWLERHQIIVKTLYDLSDTSNPVDIISISEHLKSKKLLEKVGNVSYLTKLTNQGLSSSNIEYYANLITEKSQRRTIIKSMLNILDKVQDESTSVHSLLEQSEKDIFSITNKSFQALNKSFELFYQDFLTIAEERLDTKNPGTGGISTKFARLDDILSGFHNGDLIILAARPSIGKTALALNFIDHITIQDRIPSAFFSLEMSGVDIVSRIICMETRIEADKIRKNMLTTDDIQKIIQSFTPLLDVPLLISDSPSMSIFDIRIQARRLVKLKNIKIIFIDYLGLIGYFDEQDVRYNIPRHEKFLEISRQLKALARELNIPIVVLAQLNRDVENKVPNLASIRDSGAIEQDADVVMFLHREDRQLPHTKLMVAKQRNGPVGDVTMQFQANTMRFQEMPNTSSTAYSQS